LLQQWASLRPVPSDEQPVERVAMVERQSSDLGGVGNAYGEGLDAIQRQLCGDKCLRRLSQCQLATANFDSHLPQAASAQAGVVGATLSEAGGGGAKLGAAIEDPKKCVRMAQQLHGVYPAKSGRGASTSPALTI